MIDWVSCRVPLDKCSPEVREAAKSLSDRVQRVCPRTGEIRYETACWESIRSDTHQIAARASSDLWINGSPARLIGDGDAVFGNGASRYMDLKGCVKRMIAFIESYLGAGELPHLDHWIVSKVDVTGNLLLDSLDEVRDALRILNGCEGGRYRVDGRSGNTVYWSKSSRYKSGKAYAKGPHLKYLAGKSDYTGRPYTAFEIANADRLLRLELSLKSKFFKENDWKLLTPDDLAKLWDAYFDRMIGSAEIMRDDDVKNRIFEVSPTEGRAKAAFGCWAIIQSQGYERAREMFTKTSWYRHKKILALAGLSDADISAGRVVEFRRRVIEASLAESWEQIAA